MSSTGRGSKRNENDFYATPPWCTEQLMPLIDWGYDPSILEPCCGDGAILKVLDEYLPDCEYVGFDIQGGIDFLKWQPERRYSFVVTNPPYSLAQEFVDKALQVSNCVIMLLRVNFLGAKKRREWWQNNKPTGMIILSDRPKYSKNKHGKLGSDSTEYAWFIWDKTGRQMTGFEWIGRE